MLFIILNCYNYIYLFEIWIYYRTRCKLRMWVSIEFESGHCRTGIKDSSLQVMGTVSIRIRKALILYFLRSICWRRVSFLRFFLLPVKFSCMQMVRIVENNAFYEIDTLLVSRISLNNWLHFTSARLPAWRWDTRLGRKPRLWGNLCYSSTWLLHSKLGLWMQVP